MTRRTLLTAATFAPFAPSQKSNSIEIPTDNEDTKLALFTEGDENVFTVGVRTKVQADVASISVFYHEVDPRFRALRFGRLLLSQQSLALVAGWGGYGATDRQFTISRDKIQFIRVKFLDEIGKREGKVK